MNSYAKQRLINLHDNIMVQRSPSHFQTGTFYWAHVSAVLHDQEVFKLKVNAYWHSTRNCVLLIKRLLLWVDLTYALEGNPHLFHHGFVLNSPPR